jgi:hypothetical protein
MTTTFQIGDTAIFPGNVRSTVTRIHQAHGYTWITDSEGFATDAGMVHPIPEGADEHIRAADAALEAAHATLRTKGRTRPGTRRTGLTPIPETLTWSAEALELYTATTAALIELVDAKEAAGRMSKGRANELRSKARAEQAKAQQLHDEAMTQSLRTVRGY